MVGLIKYRWWLLAIRRCIGLLALLSLSACVGYPKRECPAFYHPEAIRLLPGSVGSVYQFVDDENNVNKYVIESIDTNEPYTMVGAYGTARTSSALRCDLTRKIKLISTDRTHGFEFAFRHKEDLQHAFENQLFQLHVTPFSSNENVLSEKQRLDFTFSTPYPYEDEYYHHYPKHVVNDIEYADVYIKNTFGTTKVKPTPFMMNRIVLSKGHGLIQFRLVDNTEFNIVSQ